jgi:hypothetical protein
MKTENRKEACMKKYLIIALGAAALVLFTASRATAERIIIYKRPVPFCIRQAHTPVCYKYAAWTPGYGERRGRHKGYIRTRSHRKYRGRSGDSIWILGHWIKNILK